MNTDRLSLLWLSHLVPYPPHGLGVLQRAYHLLRETARHDDVHLLAFVQREPLAASGDIDTAIGEARKALGKICASVRFVRIPSEQQRHGKSRLAVRGLLHRDGYSINWLKSPEMVEAIRSLRQRTWLDLAHFDTISLAPYLPLVDDVPCVLDHHNIESHMMLRRAAKERNPLRKAYFLQEGLKLRAYERRLCPRFTAHLTCSALDAERLRAQTPVEWVEEIQNGVDVDYFRPASHFPEQQELVFAGNMGWYPNRDAMLRFADEIWPHLKSRVPGIVMNVVGAQAPKKLRERAAHDDAFRVHGFVDDVRTYLARAAVYVCPIRDGGGTKLKILDALAMGKAIVADPIACEGIAVTPGENVIFARTSAEFATQVVRLLADPARRQRLGAKARELAESKYAYPAIGRKLSAVYRACVGAGAPISRAEGSSGKISCVE